MIEQGPQLTLVAAMSEDHVIGTGQGGIPWHGHQAADSRRLRQLCDGQGILIGRRTFDEMRGWFWNQRIFVLTHRKLDEAGMPAVVKGCESLQTALDAAREEGLSKLLVLGGGAVYEETMPLALHMELTFLHTQVSGSVYFPAWSPQHWTTTSVISIPADAENMHAMTFLSLKRGLFRTPKLTRG